MSVATSASPAWRASCAIVVSGGSDSRAAARSSKPTIDTSPGTSIRASWSARIAPKRGKVAGRENGVEFDIAVEQLQRGLAPRFLARVGVDDEPRVVRDARFVERALEAAPARDEFGRARPDRAEKGDRAATAFEEVLAGEIAALFIVRPDRRPDLVGVRRAPADEVRALAHELLEPRARGDIIAIAEQQDAVGLAAVLIVDVPVARQLLERDQQVVTGAGAGARQRAEHRQVKGVDQRVVGGRVLEEQQGDGARMLAPQPRRILVDDVVEFLGRGEHAGAGFGADRRDCPTSARDTVGCDTPASAAISNEVGRRGEDMTEVRSLQMGHWAAANCFVSRLNTYV